MVIWYIMEKKVSLSKLRVIIKIYHILFKILTLKNSRDFTDLRFHNEFDMRVLLKQKFKKICKVRTAALYLLQKYFYRKC